ncbi:MAG: MBL fold metallo-hydrolase [Nitrospinaceae bacterium]|jgi:sulfur dioxygenase
MINVRQLFDQDTWTYTYLIFDGESKESVLIDPVLERTNRDLSLVEKLDLTLIGVLETHVHADHITAAKEIRNKTGVKIYYGSKTGVKGADVLLGDGDQIRLGDHYISAIHTPGHTEGCITYFIDDKLFTGDTLFIGGTGRTDFQGGSASNTFDSCRNKLFIYPDSTFIYPAHNYEGLTVSTVGEERNSNPNVGDKIKKENFIKNENKKERPYPRRFDVSVPENMKCGSST